MARVTSRFDASQVGNLSTTDRFHRLVCRFATSSFKGGAAACMAPPPTIGLLLAFGSAIVCLSGCITPATQTKPGATSTPAYRSAPDYTPPPAYRIAPGYTPPPANRSAPVYAPQPADHSAPGYAPLPTYRNAPDYTLPPADHSAPAYTPPPAYNDNPPEYNHNGSTTPTYQYGPYPSPNGALGRPFPSNKDSLQHQLPKEPLNKPIPLKELPSASPQWNSNDADTPGWKSKQPETPDVPDPIDTGPPNRPDTSPYKPSEGPVFGPRHLDFKPRLDIDVSAPAQQQVGEVAKFELTIRNPLDKPADDVVVDCEFDPALVLPGRAGKWVRQTVGRLKAFESRRVALGLLSDQAGRHYCRFSVLSKGEETVWKSVYVEFVERKLDVEIVGPTARTVGSRAEYVVKISNRSPATLRDVHVVLQYEPRLVPKEATAGAVTTPEGLVWNLGNLPQREGLQLQVEFECPVAVERSRLHVEAKGRDFSKFGREAWLNVSPVHGPLDVRVMDRGDSLKVGDENDYVVTLLHRGTEPIRDIQFEAELPETCSPLFVDVEQEGRRRRLSFFNSDQQIVSGNLDIVRPGQPMTVTIHAKAVAAGDGEFRAVLFYPLRQPPIEVRETTTVNR